MNYTETFEEFSKGLSSTDLALYAGAGIILWILFKDKLSPAQEFVKNLVDKFSKPKTTVTTEVLVSKPVSLSTETLSSFINTGVGVKEKVKDDVFFKLVNSWKQTRDLAVQSGCTEAVRVADEMFPYLSPKVCAEKGDTDEV